MPRKRHIEEAEPDEDPTPRKVLRRAQHEAQDHSAASTPTAAETPSKRKSILRGTPTKVNGLAPTEPTPKSLRKVLFSTPAKSNEDIDDDVDHEETPTALKNDRSARRKSQQVLQKHAAETKDSNEDEDAAQDEVIAEAILDEDDSDAGDDDSNNITLVEPSSAPDTPSKSTGRPRGRPKGKRRERTPSPPPADLPPHELYFFQNRAAANKTSANTLPSSLLLNHEDYFTHINTYRDPHEADIQRLKRLHKRAFEQWTFELEAGFNICLYGYGSKRKLVMEFAEHVCLQAEEEGPPPIVVVNGYTPGLTVRDIVTSVAGVVLPKTTKLPAQPAAILDFLLDTLDQKPPLQPTLLLVHSFDHANLRKPTTQALLARLASHRSISLLATCDTPNFALLWDIALARQFRWLYHDATTCEPFRVEMDVVEEVNALLGRSGRRLGGKDGVGYVLKSLPENARSLFRILVAEQLALADVEADAVEGVGETLDAEDILGVEDEEEAARLQNTPSRRGRGRTKAPPPPSRAPVKVALVASAQGVEYRTLYHKAVEEFVCSSELNFRTLLKEFHDHQMIESRKDGMGTESLVVPFRREELEAILEELV